jgi:hypothetical protein
VSLQSLGVPPKRLSCLTVVRFRASHSHTSNSYITSLEDRVEKMEALLKRVRNMSSWARTPKPPAMGIVGARDTHSYKRSKTITFLLSVRLPLKHSSLLFLLASPSSVQRLISPPNWAQPSCVAHGKMNATPPLQRQQVGRRQHHGLSITFTPFQHFPLSRWPSREKPH